MELVYYYIMPVWSIHLIFIDICNFQLFFSHWKLIRWVIAMIGFFEQTIWYHVRRLHWPKPKRDRLIKWNKTACISFMEDPLWEYITLSRSVTKHSHHRQFVFQVGKFLSKISSETIWKNKAKFERRHLWKVLYKISSCHLKWKKNIFPIWQFLFLIGCSLTQSWNWKARMVHGRSCATFPYLSLPYN